MHTAMHTYSFQIHVFKPRLYHFHTTLDCLRFNQGHLPPAFISQLHLWFPSYSGPNYGILRLISPHTPVLYNHQQTLESLSFKYFQNPSISRPSSSNHLRLGHLPPDDYQLISMFDSPVWSPSQVVNRPDRAQLLRVIWQLTLHPQAYLCPRFYTPSCNLSSFISSFFFTLSALTSRFSGTLLSGEHIFMPHPHLLSQIIFV